MSSRQEIREFLTSRRARLSPADVGLPDTAGTRRVAGLRREEVAALAGVSVDYYVRLERGDATGLSDSVLDGLVRALRLDPAEQTHLTDLLRTTRSSTHKPRTPTSRTVAPSVQRMLDGMTATPAFVSNSRLDLVALNPLCAALYVDLEPAHGHPINLARYTFLDPRARDFYEQWDVVADMTVALLRTSVGRDPLDRELSDLIGQLATASGAFRSRWAAHHVQQHTSGRKHLHHRIVGDLHLDFDTMHLAAEPTLAITAYTAAPDSPTADALQLLANWAASIPNNTQSQAALPRTRPGTEPTGDRRQATVQNSWPEPDLA